MRKFRYPGSSGRGLAALLAGALAAAALGAPAATAAPHISPRSAKPTSSSAAPRFLTADQATLQARRTGKSVVASQLTTETSQTIANPDGTLTLTQSAIPSRVFQHGAWTGLDGTLKPNSDGTFSPAATLDQVVLSGGGRGPVAAMYQGGQGFSLSLPISLPRPTVAGDSAVYADVIPGVDLTVTVTAAGLVSDVFTVHNAAAAHDPRLQQLLDAKTTTTRGLHVATDSRGGVAVADSHGRVVFTSPPPSAWDSTATSMPLALARSGTAPQRTSDAGAPGFGAHAAKVAITAHGGSLKLAAPTALLNAPDTRYPVYIDPPYSYNPKENGWSSPGSLVADQNFWNGTVDIGTGDSDAEIGNNGSVQGEAMSLFDMPLDTSLKGAKFYSVSFGITETLSWACLTSGHDQSVDLYAPSQTLNKDNATWNSWVNNLGGSIDSQSFALGYDSSCPAGAIPAFNNANLYNTITSDIANGKSVQTLALRADDHSDNFAAKEFNPSTANLTITYDKYPNTPSGLYTEPATQCNATTTLGDTSVTLYAPVSTPTNASLMTTFNLYKTNDSTKTNLLTSANGINKDTYGWAASGQPAVMPVPEALFKKIAGSTPTQFSFIADTTDGTLSSKAWSSPCTFSWDPTQPGPATVVPNPSPTGGAQTCATLDDTNTADQAKPIGTTCSFSLGPPSTNSSGTKQNVPISGYTYQVNQMPPVTIDSTSTATISVKLTSLVNTLTVNALSTGGNVGTSTTVWFDGTALNPAALDGDLTLDGTPDLIVPGGTGTFAPGLWLAGGNGDGTVSKNPANIGADGLQFGSLGQSSPASASDWNGAQAVSGNFCSYGAQDVLAYFPTGTNAGGGTIVCNDGSSGPLHLGAPTSASLSSGAPPYRITAGALSDGNGNNATQAVAASNVSGQNTGAPDLLATINKQLVLLWTLVPGGYNTGANPAWGTPECPSGSHCDLLSNLSPDNSQDWDLWTLATAQLSSGTAMYLWKPSTGELDLWTGLTVSSDGTTLNIANKYTIDASGWNTGASLQLRAADFTGSSGIPSLWATDTTTGKVTATTPASLSNSPALATVTTTLQAPTHAWNFQDVAGNSNSPLTNTVDTTVSSSPLDLTGSGKVTWNTSDTFTPNAVLDGSTGVMNTTAAVTTSSDFTVSAWVKPMALGGVVLSQNGSMDSGFALWASSSGWSFCMAKDDSGPWNDDCAYDGAGPVQLGAWAHVAATYTAKTGHMALYVNGLNISGATHTAVTGFTSNFNIGNDLLNGKPNAYLNGSVADVQVWAGQALTADTLASASGNPPYRVFTAGHTVYPSGSHWTVGANALDFTNGTLTVTDAGLTTTVWSPPSSLPNAVLTFQSDGNLVIYDNAADAQSGTTGALWASKTSAVWFPNEPGQTMMLQPDGNLVIYAIDGKPIWDTGTNYPGDDRWQLAGNGNDDAGANPVYPTSTVTWGPNHKGTANSAAVFNSASAIATTQSPAVVTNHSYTVTCWVKLNNLTGTQAAVSQAMTQHMAFYLDYNSSLNHWNFQTVSSDTASTTWYEATGGIATAGTWTHLAAVYNSIAGTMALYVNGTQVATTSDPTPVSGTGQLNIGADQLVASGPYDNLNGSVSDVRTYPQALSATQIQAIMNS